MMKNYGYNEILKVGTGNTADGSLYPQLSKGLILFLSFFIIQSRNKMLRPICKPWPGVANCETVSQGFEAVPGRDKAISVKLKTNPAELEANPAELKTNPAELEANPAELETNPAELEKSPETAVLSGEDTI